MARFMSYSIFAACIAGRSAHNGTHFQKCGSSTPSINATDLQAIQDGFLQWERIMSDTVVNEEAFRSSRKKISIPVHFHAIDVKGCQEGCKRNGCCENIDDSRFKAQIDVMNEHFAGKDKFSCKYDDYKSQKDEIFGDYTIPPKDWIPPTETAVSTGFEFRLGKIKRFRTSFEAIFNYIYAVDDRKVLEQLLATEIFGDLSTEDFSIQDLRDYVILKYFAGSITVPFYYFGTKSGRVGDCSELNVYVLSQAAVLDMLPIAILGAGRFPWECKRTGVETVADGIILFSDTMPGGQNKSFEFGGGDTLVHEAGHWLGLFHTFQGGEGDDPDLLFGCEFGDDLQDTPMEQRPARRCPVGRNTCPNLPGDDPIHNYMDYTDDCCIYSFSKQQARRMEYSYLTFRGKAKTSSKGNNNRKCQKSCRKQILKVGKALCKDTCKYVKEKCTDAASCIKPKECLKDCKRNAKDKRKVCPTFCKTF